ncbi:MAG: M48 family metalloprotease, partial [Thermogemmatispora sp.]|uniref:M48 family metalloprotease n=1 Tax=Thermogemmatispora sp. TaxID=1968838 RepID=UPI001DFA6E19
MSMEQYIPSYERYTYRAKEAVVEACRLALQAGRYWLEGPDLLTGVLTRAQEEERTYLAQLGIEVEALKQRLSQLVFHNVTTQEATSIEGGLSPAARRVFSAAALEAGALGHERIEPLHLLLGLIVCQLPPLADYVAGPEAIEKARQIAQQRVTVPNEPEAEPEVVLIDMARQQVITTKRASFVRKMMLWLLCFLPLEIFVCCLFIIGPFMGVASAVFLSDLHSWLDRRLLILLFLLTTFLLIWIMFSIVYRLPYTILMFRQAKTLGLTTTTAGRWLRFQLGRWLRLTLALSFFIGLALWLQSLTQAWWWLPIWLLLVVWRCYVIGWRSRPRELLPGVRRPLPEGAVRQRCASLLQRLNLTLEGIYVYDTNGQINFANAYATGLGSRRRIWLTDTLLKHFRVDEIEVICAHEVAHHCYHDLRKRLVWAIFSDLIILLCLHLISSRLFAIYDIQYIYTT